MLSYLKKWWPSIAHLALILTGFLQPSVDSYAASHKAQSVTILLAWGWLLHWLTSPKNSDAVKELKESDPNVK